MTTGLLVVLGEIDLVGVTLFSFEAVFFVRENVLERESEVVTVNSDVTECVRVALTDERE